MVATPPDAAYRADAGTAPPPAGDDHPLTPFIQAAYAHMDRQPGLVQMAANFTGLDEGHPCVLLAAFFLAAGKAGMPLDRGHSLRLDCVRPQIKVRPLAKEPPTHTYHAKRRKESPHD